MKKVIIVFLLMCIIIPLFACGKEPKEPVGPEVLTDNYYVGFAEIRY